MSEWELLLDGEPQPGIATLGAAMGEAARAMRRLDRENGSGVVEVRRVDYQRRDYAGVTTRPDREERTTK